MYLIMRWLDRRWLRWHVRGTMRRDWDDRHPRLHTATEIPLSTWIRTPRTARESYETHLEPLLDGLEMRRLTEGNGEADHDQ